MKVLVTGANGYIGRYVVKSLLDMNVDVIATDIVTDEIDPRAIIVNTDIFSENKELYKQLKEPEVIIHLAWRDGFVHNAQSHIVHLSSHYKFLMDMVNDGAKQVLVMGSMHEVGYFEGAIDENTPTNPASLYAIAKNSLRQALEISLREKEVLFQWIRGYYIYGDDLKSNSIFGKILLAAQQGKKVFPFTTGKNKYDFLTCEELGNQISCVATQTKVKGIINCCSGNPLSLADKIEEFIKEKELDIKLEYGAYPDRSYDSPGVWGNNEKITEILKRR